MDNKAYLDMINSEEYIKLYEYYNQKTFMDVLGVSRRENEHSSFLAWLFSPTENHGMGDYPLKKLLQTIAFRCQKAKESNPCYSPENDKNLLNDKNSKYLENLIFGNYKIQSAEKALREKGIPNQKRLDIFIELEILFNSESETKKINLLIENKITSSENGNQTIDYAKWLFEQDGYAIPVYLMVATNKELKNLSEKQKPESKEFLTLNYQYLMDGVFEPCLLECKTDFGKNLLLEYIKCLGKALEAVEDPKNPRTLVMAISKNEKSLVKQLWDNYEEALVEQFNRHSSYKSDTTKEKDEFYIAIAETLINLIESKKIILDKNDAKFTAINNMKKVNSVSKIYYYKDNKYKKYQRKYSIGALCRELIKEYAQKVDLNQLDNKLSITELKSNAWLRGIIIEETQKSKFKHCDKYDPNIPCDRCKHKANNNCYCIEDFEAHFFVSDDEKGESKDGKTFYVARYFTVENLEKLIDVLNYHKEERNINEVSIC